MAHNDGEVWQTVAPVSGWLSSDVDAMRLQRSLRQAADTFAFKALQCADVKDAGEAVAFGSSILRSYEEEQRLVQENAMLRSQLDALRRQCEEEVEWRRSARDLQVCRWQTPGLVQQLCGAVYDWFATKSCRESYLNEKRTSWCWTTNTRKLSRSWRSN